MSDGGGVSVCNIAAFLPAIAALRPDAPAIIFPRGKRGAGPVGYPHYTYRQLDEETDRLARGFERLGLGRGRRVAVMVKPSLELFAITFALFKAGAVPVMIDPGIGLKSLKVCLAEAEPHAFIGIPQAQVARLLFGWARRSLKAIVTVGRRLCWGGLTLDDVRKAGRAGDPHLAPTQSDDIAAILFTSGSTGVPKGAIYRHGNFTAQVEMIRRTYAIEPGEIDLPTFPLFALFDPALGMTTIIPDMDAANPGRVDPAKLHKAIEEFGVTNMFGSPAVLRRLVEYGKPLPKSLRRVLSAGAAVRPAILDGMIELLPAGVQVFTPYGATESLPVASIGSAEILSETRPLTDRGAGICVGHPVAGVQVSIIAITDDPVATWTDAQLLPTGEVGEIVVRSPTVTSGYYNREKQTGLAKIAGLNGEIAHRMGDVGYLDAQGRVWYCGRKSHRVITRDGTLFTEQVEGVFSAASGFRTALVGVRGEPVICIEIESRVRFEEGWQDKLLAESANHECSRDVRKVLIHWGTFPVDIRHNAKIFREKLAVWAAGKLN
jgi:acyl-CoA synthetase (AMP-forming)/AMP-acid ligase II